MLMRSMKRPAPLIHGLRSRSTSSGTTPARSCVRSTPVTELYRPRRFLLFPPAGSLPIDRNDTATANMDTFASSQHAPDDLGLFSSCARTTTSSLNPDLLPDRDSPPVSSPPQNPLIPPPSCPRCRQSHGCTEIRSRASTLRDAVSTLRRGEAERICCPLTAWGTSAAAGRLFRTLKSGSKVLRC